MKLAQWFHHYAINSNIFTMLKIFRLLKQIGAHFATFTVLNSLEFNIFLSHIEHCICGVLRLVLKTAVSKK